MIIRRAERRYVDSLINGTSSIIKKADKGSRIVIWDWDSYLRWLSVCFKAMILRVVGESLIQTKTRDTDKD